MANTLYITFYKDVRLTSEYNEVIQPSFLEAYLNSKTKYELEVEEMYLTFNGQLPIEKTNELNINYFEFNYMKMFDSANSVTRYFFIDEITLINGVYLISYTEDLWSSYINKVNIVRGNISNIRFLKSSDASTPLFLPDDYISNKKYTINKIYNSDAHGLTKDFYIVVEYSLYTPQTQGIPVTDRTLHCGAITGVNNFVPHGYNYSSCEFQLRQLIQYMSVGKNAGLTTDGSTYKWQNIDIIRAYIVPKVYFSLANVTWSTNNQKTIISSVAESSAQRVSAIKDFDTGIFSYSKTIDANKKRFAIGTFDKPIALIYDGQTIQSELRMFIDENKFQMTLFIATNVIDLADSFEYEFAISAQTADVTQQQNISRTLKNNQLDLERGEIITKGAVSFASGLLGTAVGIASGNYVGAAQGALSTTGSLIGLHYQMERNDLDKWALNYPSYATSSSIKTSKNLMLNCYYGISEFVVDPDNNTYIENLIETIGYKTMFIVNDKTYIDADAASNTYNIVKFNNLWLTGSISQNLLMAIKSILIKGLKIYFTSNI